MKWILGSVMLVSFGAFAETWYPTSADARQLLGTLNLSEAQAKFDKGLVLELTPDTDYSKVTKVFAPKSILNQICGQSKITALTTQQIKIGNSVTMLKVGFFSAPPGKNPEFQPNLCVEYRFSPTAGKL